MWKWIKKWWQERSDPTFYMYPDMVDIPVKIDNRPHAYIRLQVDEPISQVQPRVLAVLGIHDPSDIKTFVYVPNRSIDIYTIGHRDMKHGIH